MAQEAAAGGETSENRRLLYLEGDALQLYLEMDEEQQTNTDLIKVRLKEAFFSDGAFSGYGKLKLVRWAEERVNVYTNKIQLKTAIKLTFVAGFLNGIATNTGHRKLTMGDLLTWARVLTRDTAEDTVGATQLSRSELCSR